jgi:hypothetical protein
MAHLDRSAEDMEPHINPWPFDQPRNCASFTVRQVMKKEEPILVVSHAMDDHSWSFVGPSGFRMEDAMLVCLEEVVRLDRSMLEVADLLPGWQAMRESPKHPWVRRESPPDEEEPIQPPQTTTGSSAPDRV